MCAWTNKGQNNWSLAAPSKVTLELEISRILLCLTLLAVLGFSEVLTTVKQAINGGQHAESSTSDLFATSSGFWTFNSAILRKINASRRLWKTSRERYGA